MAHLNGPGDSFSEYFLLTQPMAKRLKLSGITCLVGKIKFKLLSQGPLAE